MKISDMPASEQPREKLLGKGAAALTDAELLAIFLRTGTRGKNVLALADELIAKTHGIKGLLNSSYDEFTSHKGLGVSKYVQLQASLEMARRYLEDSLKKGISIRDCEDAKHFLAIELANEKSEVFACMFLDNLHRLIVFEKMFYGTINASHVHIREIIRRALQENAAALIVAHNHPSGNCQPSNTDRQLTKKIMQALALMDIRLIDHCIIGDGNVYSFAQHGELS